MTQKSKVKWRVGIVTVLVIGSAAALTSCGPKPHRVGSVNTEFKLIGPDHKIVIESYDDPKIDGITVFISKSQKGGIKGALGLAEDTSDASVAVRQTGPIKVKEAFENGEDAFTEQRSVLFKRLHVSRFWDAPHKSFVYVVWTDRLINGSPQNSISAVVAQPWGNQAPDLSLIGQLLQRRRNKSCFSGHAPVRKLIDAANNCGWKHNRWLETPLCDAA